MTGKRSAGPRTRLAAATVLVSTVAAIVAIATVDYITGVEIRTFPLYVAPIAFVASRFGVRAGVAASAACTAIWLVTSVAARHPHPAWLIACNGALQLGASVMIAFVVARLAVLAAAERLHARRDLLTGLPNRLALQERAALEYQRLERSDVPVVVACMDLDRFKAINDERGHEAGDRVLLLVASVAQRHLRAIDMIARVGGDEFVLLLPGLTPSDARAVLDRVREAIERELAASGSVVTASIGAVVIRRGERGGLADALRRADAAMYVAKQAGRNRLWLDAPPP